MTDGEEVRTTVLDLGDATLQRATKGDLCIITVSGVYTKALGKEIERHCFACTTNLGLEFIDIKTHPVSQKRFDTSIVGFLRAIRDKFRARKKLLLLCMPPSDLVDLLKLTGVYDGYTIIDKPSDAVLSSGAGTPPATPEETSKPAAAELAPVSRRIISLNQSLKRTATLEKGLESAEKCVKHFLPQAPPVCDGWSFAFAYRSSERVGGDFFDFIPISETEIGLLVGDVSGHGLDAAILMGITKKVINLRARDTVFDSPRKTLIQVNQDLASDFNKYNFVTVLYGRLNLDSGELTIARAGHEMPILFGPKTPPAVIASAGIPVGPASSRIFENALDQTQTVVQPGSYVLFFTDGLSECWSPRGETFGRERLLFALSHLKHEQSCQQALDQLLAELSSFAGDRPQEDDMTAVLLKRL